MTEVVSFPGAGAQLSMRETAAQVGKAYETFRKAWKRMTQTQDFPAPVVGEPFDYLWDAAAVERWKQRRSARVVQAAQPKPEPRPVHRPSRSGRSALQALKGG